MRVRPQTFTRNNLSSSEELVVACQSAEHSLIAYNTGEPMACIVEGCPQHAAMAIGRPCYKPEDANSALSE